MALFFRNLQKHSKKIALSFQSQNLTYEQLLSASSHLSQLLPKTQDQPLLILHQLPKNLLYPLAQIAIFQKQHISIPICPSTHPSEILYCIEKTRPALILTTFENNTLKQIANSKNIPISYLSDELLHASAQFSISEIPRDRNCLMLFTSGTTGNKKGVLHNWRSLETQMDSLTQAWEWSSSDEILSFLPLNHIHGVMNVLNTALYNGAQVEMMEKCDIRVIWDRFLNQPPTVFMAVPSVYMALIEYYHRKIVKNYTQHEIRLSFKKIRLMVSGSSALALRTFIEWESITGHKLLERYGMTEVGMALSNPINGPRVPLQVGTPLPHVICTLYNNDTQSFIDKTNESGELLIKGDTLFTGYYEDIQKYEGSFLNGWFKTGDLAIRNDKNAYILLGRISQDIIKCRGHKVSTLEIEQCIREFQEVKDVAVVGNAIDDGCVAFIVGENVDVQALKEWCSQSMNNYMVPQEFRIIEELDRNAMGKVDKKKMKQRLM